MLGVVVVLALVATALIRSVDGAPPGQATPTPTATPAPTPTPEPLPLSTPLADYDTSALTVQRSGFCDLLAPEDVAAALGGAPDTARTYGNGESTTISSGVTDIAHEYGCRWKRGPTVLRAWVFAPPVTPGSARLLIRAARATDGCAERRDAPAYGSVSIARTCPVDQGFEASYRGLFGDAWLACSLTTRGGRASVLAQAGAWCVAVAEAAAQPPA